MSEAGPVREDPELVSRLVPLMAERLRGVRERMAAAARRSGRAADAVRLVAVSKFHPAVAVAAAAACGQRVFGENYVQEALAKQDQLRDSDLEWHSIGHVQSNKAGDVAGRFALIHALDSLKLAGALNRRMTQMRRAQDVLIQVNIGAEPQKAGVLPADLPGLAEAVAALPGLRLRGLMCLPPFFDDAEAARPFFVRLRELRDGLRSRLDLELPELSMGMSGDFEQAVEEGATLVRVGTTLFGPRPPARPEKTR